MNIANQAILIEGVISNVRCVFADEQHKQLEMPFMVVKVFDVRQELYLSEFQRIEVGDRLRAVGIARKSQQDAFDVIDLITSANSRPITGEPRANQDKRSGLRPSLRLNTRTKHYPILSQTLVLKSGGGQCCKTI